MNEKEQIKCLPPMDDELKWILGRPGFTLINEAPGSSRYGTRYPTKSRRRTGSSPILDVESVLGTW